MSLLEWVLLICIVIALIAFGWITYEIKNAPLPEDEDDDNA